MSVLRIRDVYLGSWFLSIPNPGSRILDQGSNKSNKREGGKTCCPTFFVATNITKLKIILFLNRIKKLSLFSKSFRTFYPKNCHNCKLSKIWVWDPGSRGLKRHRIRIRNTRWGNVVLASDCWIPFCNNWLIQEVFYWSGFGLWLGIYFPTSVDWALSDHWLDYGCSFSWIPIGYRFHESLLVGWVNKNIIFMNPYWLARSIKRSFSWIPFCWLG